MVLESHIGRSRVTPMWLSSTFGVWPKRWLALGVWPKRIYIYIYIYNISFNSKRRVEASTPKMFCLVFPMTKTVAFHWARLIHLEWFWSDCMSAISLILNESDVKVMVLWLKSRVCLLEVWQRHIQAGMIGYITLQQRAPSQMTLQDSNTFKKHYWPRLSESVLRQILVTMSQS